MHKEFVYSNFTAFRFPHRCLDARCSQRWDRRDLERFLVRWQICCNCDDPFFYGSHEMGLALIITKGLTEMAMEECVCLHSSRDSQIGFRLASPLACLPLPHTLFINRLVALIGAHKYLLARKRSSASALMACDGYHYSVVDISSGSAHNDGDHRLCTYYR